MNDLNNDLLISKVETSRQIEEVEELAERIWHHHFIPIIGLAQVEYMLKKFQSRDAIQAQMDQGYEYYLLSLEGRFIGYTAIFPNHPPGVMFLSKIYIEHTMRSMGCGQFLLDFIAERSREERLEKIRLTVNKDNFKTIQWYKNRDFIFADKVETDIGEGFIMDDYIMELDL